MDNKYRTIIMDKQIKTSIDQHVAMPARDYIGRLTLQVIRFSNWQRAIWT